MPPLRLHQHESVSPHRRLRTDRPGPRGHGGDVRSRPARSPSWSRSAAFPLLTPRCGPGGPGLATGPLQVTGGARGRCAALGDSSLGRTAEDALPREPPGDLWQGAPSDRPAAAPRPAPALPSRAARGGAAAGGGKKSGRSVPVAVAVIAASSAPAARGHGPAAQLPQNARPDPPPPPQPPPPPPRAPPPPAPPRSAPPPLSRRFPPSPAPAAAAATAARSHWRENGGRPGNSRDGGGARAGPVPATAPGRPCASCPGACCVSVCVPAPVVSLSVSVSRLLPCPSPSPRECQGAGPAFAKPQGAVCLSGAGGCRPLPRGRLSWPQHGAWVGSGSLDLVGRGADKTLRLSENPVPSFFSNCLPKFLPDSSGHRVCI